MIEQQGVGGLLITDHAVSGDFDGDGDVDIIAYTQGGAINGRNLVFFENSGNGEFEDPAVAVELDASISILRTVDFNQNGFLDIVIQIVDEGLYWFENDGSAQFSDIRAIYSTAPADLSHIEFADLEADDDIDIVVAQESEPVSEMPKKVFVLENDGSESFGVGQIVYESENIGGWIFSIHLLDIDDDDDQDLFIGQELHPWNRSYVNDGTGEFSLFQEFLETNSGSFRDVASGDLDGDSDPDLVHLSVTEAYARFNDGSGQFSGSILLAELLPYTYDIALEDMDNDGDLDALIAGTVGGFNSESYISFFENIDGLGDLRFSCDISTQVGGSNHCIHVADFNQDEDIDIIVNDGTFRKLSYFENRLDDDVFVLRGRVFWDIDDPLKYDYSDIPIGNIPVTIQPADTTIHTDADGLYYFETSVPGEYSLSIEEPTSGLLCNAVVELDRTSPPSIPVYRTYESFRKHVIDFTYAHQQEECRAISGFVFYDLNANGIKDEDEEGREGVIVRSNGFGAVITNSAGEFSLKLPENADLEISLDLENSRTLVYCDITDLDLEQTYPPGNGTYMYNSSDADVDTLLFGVTSDEGNLYDVGVFNLMVQNGNSPGKTFHGWIDFKAIGNLPDFCTLRIEHDEHLALLESDIPPANTGPGFVEWFLDPNFLPYRYCMDMQWFVDSTLDEQNGDTLYWKASYSCSSGNDACAENDEFEAYVVVDFINGRLEEAPVQLYSVRPQGIMPEYLTEQDRVLSYIISFQNPLETTADQVIILDQLPEGLDWETISYPFTSHPEMDFSLSDEGLLSIVYNEIDLPSMLEDELDSYGFLQFHIRLKEDLDEGTVIENSANVIFGSYENVQSNTVVHRIEGEVVSVVEELSGGVESVSIYPNPASEYIFVKLKQPGVEDWYARVFDVLGHEIARYRMSGGEQGRIDLSGLSPGCYIVEAHDAAGRSLGADRLIVR